ncbi:MAG: methyltransferase domain-containing protein [Coriobacteriaceae bacterium]|nr:methyltransferase domain-containing protein [Coriobacteriaceae bacterium]
MSDIHDEVSQYYGKTLESTRDLKTNACCCAGESLSAEAKAALALIPDAIVERFYGCGSPLPPLLEGCTVLDLGCGTGRDVYLASRLVGEAGHVIGVDMTPSQMAVAREHQDEMRLCYGYERSNVELIEGYIEDLEALGIASNSVDVVISNCVINLSPAKEQVFKEVFRVLKPGGELYFSDVFADRRIPADLQADPVLRGECLGGALYIEDFRRLLSGLGCHDFRTTASHAISIENPEIEALVGFARFTSQTIRAFKLDLEDRCEDYGQIACYRGNLPGHPHRFDLDARHRFSTGKPELVCGNTAEMLAHTRYAALFEVVGGRDRHFGGFDCGCIGTGTGTGKACNADSSRLPADAAPATEDTDKPCCC